MNSTLSGTPFGPLSQLHVWVCQETFSHFCPVSPVSQRSIKLRIHCRLLSLPHVQLSHKQMPTRGQLAKRRHDAPFYAATPIEWPYQRKYAVGSWGTNIINIHAQFLYPTLVRLRYPAPLVLFVLKGVVKKCANNAKNKLFFIVFHLACNAARCLLASSLRRTWMGAP